MASAAPAALTGLGRFFVMAVRAVGAIPRGVHLAELLEQTVFIAKVSLLPVVFVTIPLTVVVQFFIGQLLTAIGADVERRALARAVRWHAEHRVLLDGHRTIVFR